MSCKTELSGPTSRLEAHQLQRYYWRAREHCHPATPTLDKRRQGQWSLRFLLTKAGHSTDVSQVINRGIRHQERHCVRFLFQYYYWLFKFLQLLFIFRENWWITDNVWGNLLTGKGKGKVHPRTGHEVPDGVLGSQRHAPAALPPGMARYPLYRRLGEPQGRSGHVLKISPPPGFVPRTV